jgi:hypothetical protein
MTNGTDMRTLGEAALDLVVGGLRDKPAKDYYNKLAADANGKDGTVGGSINSNYYISVVGSNGGSIPFDFPGA